MISPVEQLQINQKRIRGFNAIPPLFLIKKRACFGKLTFDLAGVGERTCLIS